MVSEGIAIYIITLQDGFIREYLCFRSKEKAIKKMCALRKQVIREYGTKNFKKEVRSGDITNKRDYFNIPEGGYDGFDLEIFISKSYLN